MSNHFAKDPLTALTLSTPDSLWKVTTGGSSTFWHVACLQKHQPAWKAMLSFLYRTTRHYSPSTGSFTDYTETTQHGTITVYDSVRDFCVADGLTQAQINWRVKKKCQNCALKLLP